MSENRDPAIKLFGKTIPVHPVGDLPPLDEEDDQNKSTSESKEKIEPFKSISNDSSRQTSTDKDDGSVDEPATVEQPDDSSDPKQKTLKKPDKILPCPRCKSMDTKFCYYNNYNINQPRHFCKNCQRYWTAGGTMRNVPVGAGRRKNKNSASHYRQLAVVNPSFQATVPDLVSYTRKPNGTVLSFGSDMQRRGSVASVLTAAGKNTKSCDRNGFHHQMEDKAAPPCCSTENGDVHSSRSSEGSPNSEGAADNNSSVINNKAAQDFAAAPCFDGTPWMYSWIPAPALCASSFPVPFYPAAAGAYWSCPVPPGTLGAPWMPPPSPTPSAVTTCPQGAALAPIFPTLGKRSRDEDTPANVTVLKKEASGKHDSQERCIWTPKALRIDDPEEAAKSSIWTMVGAKNGKFDAISGGCLFKALHPSDDITDPAVRPSQLLHANPAALSRSLNFQESS